MRGEKEERKKIEIEKEGWKKKKKKEKVVMARRWRERVGAEVEGWMVGAARCDG